VEGGEEALFNVSGEFGVGAECSGDGVGKAQAVNLGKGGWLNRLFCKVYMGCKVLEKMVLKRVLGAVQ
jgi:hypothetical protein